MPLRTRTRVTVSSTIAISSSGMSNPRRTSVKVMTENSETAFCPLRSPLLPFQTANATSTVVPVSNVGWSAPGAA